MPLNQLAVLIWKLTFCRLKKNSQLSMATAHFCSQNSALARKKLSLTSFCLQHFRDDRKAPCLMQNIVIEMLGSEEFIVPLDVFPLKAEHE